MELEDLSQEQLLELLVRHLQRYRQPWIHRAGIRGPARKLTPVDRRDNGHCVFQLVEVAVPRKLFAAILVRHTAWEPEQP